MLKKVVITNFKNFKLKTVFDLGTPANYEFNDEIIKNGCLTKGIVYGINGSGKSNLALAIFDIVLHLTDKQKMTEKYLNYLNLDSNKPVADFEYFFTFNKHSLIYRYSKKDATTLVRESLLIDDSEVMSYDFVQKEGYSTLRGTENLQLSSKINSAADKLSRVKYINSNAILEDNEINRTFVDFVNFVDNMLMFYSLDGNGYQGFSLGADSFTQGIIRENKMREFEEFLRSRGIDYHLESVEINGIKELFCRYNNSLILFTTIASTGTRSLALFYYWYIKMSSASFVFIDEYDAFYHFELSQSLVQLLKGLGNTQVILSTHNTDLLSNELLRPDAYFIIDNNSIKSLDKLTSKELRKAHNIQKMYKAGTFNE